MIGDEKWQMCMVTGLLFISPSARRWAGWHQIASSVAPKRGMKWVMFAIRKRLSAPGWIQRPRNNWVDDLRYEGFSWNTNTNITHTVVAIKRLWFFPKKTVGEVFLSVTSRLYANAVSLSLEDTKVKEASYFQQIKSWKPTIKKLGNLQYLCNHPLKPHSSWGGKKTVRRHSQRTTPLHPRRHQHTQSPAPFHAPLSPSHSFPIHSQNPWHRFLITAATNTSFREFWACHMMADDPVEELLLVASRKWKKNWSPPIVWVW